jgi:hypothetical protein
MRARKKEIPKDGGKVRVLSIPAIRDRVVQGAAKLILEPIFEADFQPGSYGYPGNQYPWYGGYYLQDLVPYFPTPSDPNPSPPAYVPSTDPRYGENVQSWTQEWHFGTASIGFGTFLQTGTLNKNVSFVTLNSQQVPVP